MSANGPATAGATLTTRLRDCRRLLLVEANNQRRWVGSRVAPEIHIPPIGLLYLATYARMRRPDLEIEIIETSLDTPTDEAFTAKLASFAPDVVGIRSISLFEAEFRRTAELTRAACGAVIVGGGPIATAKRGALLEHVPAVDLVVTGEGEATFSALLAGEQPGGVVLRDGERIVDLGEGEVVDDLDTLPFPDYGLIDVANYEHHLSYAYNYRRQGVLLTSRGCPFRCTYCNTFAGKTARMRSARNVFDEMERLSNEHAIRDFYVVDDIFNIRRERLRELFGMIIERDGGWRLYFVNGLRADIMTRELVDSMVAAGTVWVTYAIESGSPRIQKLVKKHLNLEKAIDIIAYSQDQGIVVNVNTMYGFPSETPEDAQLTLECLARLRMPSVLPYHFCLRGYEGCEIIEQAGDVGWDTSAFLGDSTLSYNSVPTGTPTFPRRAMIEHLLQYHARFGLDNPDHVRAAVALLRRNGYTERDLTDMYSVLLNRTVRSVGDLERGVLAHGGIAS